MSTRQFYNTPMSSLIPGGAGGGGGGGGGGGDRQYELPNAFFAPANELTFNKVISSNDTITFNIERNDTPQLTVPATTIGVKVIQYNSANDELNNKEYTLYNGDKLYYEQEPPAAGAVKVVVKITNWSRAYDSSTDGKTTINVKGLEQ